MTLAVIGHSPRHTYCFVRTSSTLQNGNCFDCLTRPAFIACVTPLQNEEALTDLEDDCGVVEGGLTPLETVGGLSLPVRVLARLVHNHDCDQVDSGTVHAVVH